MRERHPRHQEGTLEVAADHLVPDPLGLLQRGALGDRAGAAAGHHRDARVHGPDGTATPPGALGGPTRDFPILSADMLEESLEVP
jgi:hypothetical protein